MRRFLPTTVAALVLALAITVAATAAGERERWQDDAGDSQGVEFTRDITHTLVPTFFDKRAATFTCDDGSSFEDPLVVIAAGDGSGRDLDLKIGSDGSFSYSGPANWTKGAGTMAIQGRFAGATASGTVQWTSSRPSSDGSQTCSGSAAPAQWSAHCSEQCGGSSGGAITITTNGRPVIGQWALVDVTVNSDGAGRIAAFAHHGSRACGTFADEDGAAARKGTFGAIERLGEGQIPGSGTYVFHGKYIPDQFGHSD